MRNIYTFVFLLITAFFANQNIFAYNIVVAKDGTGDVTTVQAAFDKVPSNNSQLFTIYVKKGTYKEKVRLVSGKNNVSVLGEAAATTIITYDDYAAKVGSTAGSYSVSIEANDFTAQNITFENTIDSRLSQYSSNGQGVALNVTGDRIAFYDCIIKGFQDTYFNSGKGRVYTKCCTIYGTTDFIFGSGVNILEDCIIINLKSSATTAASNKNANNSYNYLFLHCELKAGSSGLSCTLGRPWGAQARVVFYECVEGSHIKADGWQNWSSADYSATAYFAEYNCSGAGYQPTKRISWSHQLTAAEAAKYTVAKMFAKNANADTYSADWIPTLPSGACGTTASPTLALTSGTASQKVSSGTAISNIVYTWGGSATDVSVTGLPAGLTATKNTTAKTVTIAGTPSATGTYTLTTAQPSGTAVVLTGTISVTVSAPTLVLTTGLATQTIVSGTAITSIVYTWGGGATDVTVTGLPAGLTATKNIIAKTVTIAGTPTASGTFTLTTVQPSGTAVVLTGIITITQAVVSIPLHAGWNLVGYPFTGSTNIETAFASVLPQIDVVKNLDAFYSTSQLPVFNSLTNVQWGQGYWVKVTKACTLTWAK